MVYLESIIPNGIFNCPFIPFPSPTLSRFGVSLGPLAPGTYAVTWNIYLAQSSGMPQLLASTSASLVVGTARWWCCSARGCDALAVDMVNAGARQPVRRVRHASIGPIGNTVAGNSAGCDRRCAVVEGLTALSDRPVLTRCIISCCTRAGSLPRRCKLVHSDAMVSRGKP